MEKVSSNLLHSRRSFDLLAAPRFGKEAHAFLVARRNVRQLPITKAGSCVRSSFHLSDSDP